MTDTPIPTLPEAPGSVPTVPYLEGTLGGDASSLAEATLGPFEIEDVIGKGGMGVVFRGRHRLSGVAVAIKVITRAGAVHPHFRQALRNEVQAVAGLSHPGVVRVLDYGDIGEDAEHLSGGELKAGSPYYVMEYHQLGTLLPLMGRVTWKQAKALLLSLLDALAHAHALGVIHRDIKPGNILLSEFGGRVIPTLADFGLAFAEEGNLGQTLRSIGTPQYMSPEQIEAPWRKHGPWSDLYSVGCVAFELLVGKRLVTGESMTEIFQAHLDGDRRQMLTVLQLPDGFRAWLDKMLNQRVADRFQTAADAARALMELDDSKVREIRPPEATALAIGGLMPVLDIFRPKTQLKVGGFERVWSSIAHGSVNSEARIPERWESPRYEKTPMKLIGAGLGLFGLRTIPMLGRDKEVEVLWQLLREVEAQAKPQVVILRGAEGCGRTRLGDGFAQRVLETGVAHVLRATHTPQAGRADGLPRMMAKHLRTLGADEAGTRTIVQDEMKSRGFEDNYISLAMTSLTMEGMDIAPSKNALRFSTPRQKYALIKRYLTHLSSDRPVVIWLEDCQWSGDTLEFVKHISSQAETINAPLLLLVSVTDGLIAQRKAERAILDDILEHPATTVLELAALDDNAHEALISALATLDDDLSLELCERTAGNPRLAVELLGDWVSRGLLQVSDTGFVLKKGAHLSIPDSLHEVWEERIDGFLKRGKHDDRIALEIAAALGLQVDATEWEHVCRLARVEISPGFQASLVQRRFAIRTDTGWAFAHSILRESIERRASDEGRWREHHLRCAYFIESNRDTDRPSEAERFGRHLFAAREFEQALAPIWNGVVGRRTQGEYRDTLRLLSSYLRGLEKLQAGPSDERYGKAWAYRARTHVNAGDPKSALRWGERAVRAAEENGWNEVAVEANAWLSVAKQWLGMEDAADAMNTAISQLSMLSVTTMDPAVYVYVAHVLGSLRRFGDARELLHLNGLMDRSDLGLANNLLQECRLSILEGKWEQALSQGEKTVEAFERLGHYPALSQALEYLAEVYRQTDQLQEARELYLRCIELQTSIGYPTIISQLNLGAILLQESDFQEAEKTYMLVNEAIQGMGRRRFELVAGAGLAASAAGLGNWNSLRDIVRQIGEQLDVQMEGEPDIAILLERAGDFANEQDEFFESEAAWELALRVYQHAGLQEKVDKIQEKLSDLELF